MEYGKGTIVLQSRSRFADGSYDPHGCRPTVIALASDSITDETYYLLITSQVRHYLTHPDEYFSLEEELWRDVGLMYPSLIKLDKVHKGHVSGDKEGGLPPNVYKQMIRKLKEYKAEHPDENYDEIKRKL